MRRWMFVLCAGIVAIAYACDNATTTSSPGVGQLLFQKDSSCTDTTNTELFIDDLSQGQFTMHPGSIEGFNKTATEHVADAIERSGKLRDFGLETVIIPALGQAFYVMKCPSTRPPPDTNPAPPSRPGR